MDESRVTRELEVQAGREEVWRALTDPDRLSEWLAEEVSVELTPGGDLRVRTADGEQRTGWIEEVEEPRRLSFWWRCESAQEASRVQLELEDAPDGTRVTVTETRPLATLDLVAAELYRVARGTTGGPTALAGVARA